MSLKFICESKQVSEYFWQYSVYCSSLPSAAVQNVCMDQIHAILSLYYDVIYGLIPRHPQLWLTSLHARSNAHFAFISLPVQYFLRSSLILESPTGSCWSHVIPSVNMYRIHLKLTQRFLDSSTACWLNCVATPHLPPIHQSLRHTHTQPTHTTHMHPREISASESQ